MTGHGEAVWRGRERRPRKIAAPGAAASSVSGAPAVPGQARPAAGSQWVSTTLRCTTIASTSTPIPIREMTTMPPTDPILAAEPTAIPNQPKSASPKVVFSSSVTAVDWNTRLVTGDAVTEITRLKAEEGGPMDVAGATLAAAAMRAGLIDEYAIVTHPVLLVAVNRSSQPWTTG